ncbi:hypothetical protein [Sulfurovum sp.]|uniref:hypothetical protein n=1 Tax=Sulfurovum sp. TaxID=1969726 RepID=UPI002867D02A|nr:hypothetical protein [Sulfurovum sp.]
MNDRTKEIIQIESFLDDVVKKVKEGIEYRDAIQLSAVIIGGEIARLVSQSINKYQEATYEKTELFQQENVDECALASMGKLWHDESFDGSDEQMASSQEETVLDSLYFILKYAKSQDPQEDALKANDTVCGDKVARKKLIEQAFNVE